MTFENGQDANVKPPIPYGYTNQYSLFLHEDGSVTGVLQDEGADNCVERPASDKGAAEYEEILLRNDSH